MKFTDFIGNNAIVDSLKNSIVNERVANAYLFAGPEGVGKRFLAFIGAASLLCKDFAGEPCGQCSSCLRIQEILEGEGFHPDLHVLEPDGKFIKVEQMRSRLISSTQLQPHESRYQVFIIDQAETMHPSAANAFLKTLEEAPGHSVFFLITKNAVALLPTIRSRCQTFNFQRMASDDLARELVLKNLIKEDDAAIVADLSGGAVGKALRLDLEEYTAERNLALKFIRLALREGNAEEIFTMSALMHKQADRFQSRLDHILALLRDIMLIASAGSSVEIINTDIKSTLVELARGRSARMLSRLMSKIADMQEPLIRNVRADSISEHVMLTGRSLFRNA